MLPTLLFSTWVLLVSAQTTSSAGGVVIQQYQNNPSNIIVQGLEMQGEADVGRTLGLGLSPGTRWSAPQIAAWTGLLPM